MSKQLKKSGCDAIRSIASKFGFGHSNRFYIDQVRREYGMTVSQVQVIQSIGAAKTRQITVEPHMLIKAQELLIACNHDMALVRAAVGVF
ncbi:MAG: hypothetical protein K0U90_07750 [Planctomycetes bacterium]|nr:hypothetical protein [Planctomycetota bacterium]